MKITWCPDTDRVVHTGTQKSRYEARTAIKPDHNFLMNQEHCFTDQCISLIKYPLLFIAVEAPEVGIKARKWEETCPALPVDEIPMEPGSQVWWLLSQVWELWCWASLLSANRPGKLRWVAQREDQMNMCLTQRLAHGCSINTSSLNEWHGHLRKGL